MSLSQSGTLIGSYLWARLSDQLRSAAPVVLYLLAVQVVLLGVPVKDAAWVALGVVMVVVGLAAFLEGLMLAVMPLGELCGVDLPRRARVSGILTVVFALGLLGTLAEPSIAVLQRMGATVTPWDAPLLFVLLGRHSFLLVLAIGIGVGIAFTIGIVRSLLGWSLKPVLAVSVALVLAGTLWARTEPNLALVFSLSWDTGAITTSDVTVPLMLALGAGLSRMGGSEEGGGSGFGSVALASLVPIVTVLTLAAVLLPTVPGPMTREEFLARDKSSYIGSLFENEEAYDAWAEENLTAAERGAVPGETERGPEPGASGSTAAGIASAEDSHDSRSFRTVLFGATEEAVRAVLPLSVILIVIVRFVLRRKLPWPDETVLGIFLCLAGMAMFSTGVEVGLLRLGNQSGTNLANLVQPTDHLDEAVLIPAFDRTAVAEAITEDGTRQAFFLYSGESGTAYVPFHPERYDETTGSYLHIPRSGPLIPGIWGWAVLLIVAFGLGFTTTLVEPAVAALGITVENITVGVFSRGKTILIVSLGVGVGTLAGITMLVWKISLFWLLVPLYIGILILTAISSELFTGIGWDAGGATTASITTPLVLAIGAGLGHRIGVAESFGILTLASSFPILGVLVAGMFVDRNRPRKGGTR
jgi:hypothetical protein